MKHTDARTLSPQTQYELRKLVIRLRKKEMANKQVAEVVGTTESHASAIWRAYERDGMEAIKPKVRGRRHGAKRRLTAEQETAIQKLLIDSIKTQAQENISIFLIFPLLPTNPFMMIQEVVSPQ